MGTIKQGAVIAIFKTAVLLRNISEILVNKAKKIHSVPGTHNLTIQAIENLSIDADKFRENALKVSALANDQELKEAVYLYFLTKQAASIYEAKIQYLPLQVYNEMRNALDHYFRAVISTDASSRASHIRKVEGHLQRAFLDITKLTCAESMEIINRTHARIGEPGLSLANNGEYIKNFTDLKVNAEETLITAKLNEYSLGDGGEASVRDTYIEALSAHNLAYSFHKKNLGNLWWGKAKVFSFRPISFVLGLLTSLIGGYAVRFAWAVSENLPIIKKLINSVKNIAS